MSLILTGYATVMALCQTKALWSVCLKSMVSNSFLQAIASDMKTALKPEFH